MLRPFILFLIIAFAVLHLWTFVDTDGFLSHSGIKVFMFFSCLFTVLGIWLAIWRSGKTKKGKNIKHTHPFGVVVLFFLFFYTFGWAVYGRYLDIYGSVKVTDQGMVLKNGARTRIVSEKEIQQYDVLKARTMFAGLVFILSGALFSLRKSRVKVR